MPRVGRESLKTEFFHIIVQGINREYIFKSEKYIEKYISLIKKYRENYKEVKLIAYCIMNNHAHLLINCKYTYIMGQFMKGINTTYARYYNKNENRVGYVFRNRYLSQPIYTKEHLLSCMKYIHSNPVTANIITKESEYEHSSYNDYIQRKGIATEEVIRIVFGSVKGYIETFMQINVGDSKFIECVEEKIDVTERIETYCICKKISLKELKDKERELIKLLKYLSLECKVSKTEIAEVIGVNRTRVIRLLKD